MRRFDRLDVDDGGDTLVELLVAIVIMGLVFVIVLSGIGTAIVGAATQRSLTTVNTVLTSAAGAVAADPYVACARHYDLGAAPPAGYRLSITSVQYWDGVSSFVADCDPDNGLQQLTIHVVHDGDTGAAAAHDRVVVKRDES